MKTFTLQTQYNKLWEAVRGGNTLIHCVHEWRWYNACTRYIAGTVWYEEQALDIFLIVSFLFSQLTAQKPKKRDQFIIFGVQQCEISD